MSRMLRQDLPHYRGQVAAHDVFVKPIVLAVREVDGARIAPADGFGTSGAPWATTFGVTVGDSLVRTRGGGLWSGVGGWRAPILRLSPVPLGLRLYVRIRSPQFHETDSRFAGIEPLVLDRMSVGTIATLISQRVGGLGELTSDQLVEALRRWMLVIDDDDDDDDTDYP